MATGGITAALLFAAPGAALADPSIISVRLDRPAQVGRSVNLQVRAVDSQSAISGMVVSFGRGEQPFGLSACRLAGSSGRLRAPFARGSRVRMTVPHQFRTRGPRPVLVRVDSGACDALAGSVFQPITVTPTRPGEQPIAIVLGTPINLPAGVPGLPGTPGSGTGGGGGGGGGGDTGGLPDLPLIDDLPGLPDVPDLPDTPPLPGLPGGSGLPPLPGLPVLASARKCRGATRSIGRSARRRKVARAATVCLLNAIRRRSRLKPLRQNRRLLRAAKRHSGSMVKRRYFAHVEPGGVDLLDRLRRVRYIPRKRSWGAGENLAFGEGRASSPLALVIAWMGSTHHRANIMTRNFREIGLGISTGIPQGSRRGATLTSDFGFRR